MARRCKIGPGWLRFVQKSNSVGGDILTGTILLKVWSEMQKCGKYTLNKRSSKIIYEMITSVTCYICVLPSVGFGNLDKTLTSTCTLFAVQGKLLINRKGGPVTL